MAVNTCLLYSELAIGLGASLEPFCDLLLSNLLKMANLTKKITAQQSQTTVTSILTHSSSQPKIVITLLWTTLQEKAVQARAFVVGHIKTYLEVHGRRAKSAIETSGTLEVLDKCMRRAITDTSPAVREVARKVFWKFHRIWPASGATILESLDSVNRRQLEKVCPNLDQQENIPSITPKTIKKGSVAAAIAASRAKAKAIAIAPPTLYHQATSASHNLPGRRRSGSPSSSTSRTDNARPISPLRLSSSPPSVRPPAPTGGCGTTPTLSAHRRSSSGSSGRGSCLLSLPDMATGRQFNGSNSISSRGTQRRAVQTALPVSPPTSPLHTSPTPRATSRLTRHAPPRPSSLYPQMNNEDESLLLAQSVPIPLDDESDYDLSTNLLPLSNPSQTFCSPVRKPLTPPESQSPRSNSSKPIVTSAPSVSNAHSSGSIVNADQPIVEDAMKARAEQAESAAERLLELVDPDVENTPHPSFPPSLLLDRQFIKPSRLPATPASNTAQILKQAAMFQDSPANSGRTSLMDVLQDAKQESWWPKRKAGE